MPARLLAALALLLPLAGAPAAAEEPTDVPAPRAAIATALAETRGLADAPAARRLAALASGLLDHERLGVMHAPRVAQALAIDDPAPRARALRGAFASILDDLAFEPRMEAPLPQGFPAPGPVGSIVRKAYPRYRRASAEGGERGAFWTLFRHIKARDVAMTAPVEMRLGDDLGTETMAFLYERPEQGEAGREGMVAVEDLPPMEVLSLGLRGYRQEARLRAAREALAEHARDAGLEPAGPFRVMGYNSPAVLGNARYFEVQLPVRAKAADEGSD